MIYSLFVALIYYRNGFLIMSQLSFIQLGIGNKKLRSEVFLSEMDSVIPWDRLCSLIKPYYSNNRLGRRRMPLCLMLRIYFLQQWYNLSDPQAEDWIYDRISFQRFLKLDLISDSVPDETTILNFRHLLERHDLTQAIFDSINQLLIEKGLLLQEGTIVDASIIHAPTSTKNAKKKRDTDMSSTKKGNKWYFGMKMHIGTQVRGRPIIHSVQTSTAKEHDRQYKQCLLHGKEKIICGDKGYSSDKDKSQFREAGIFCAVLDKAKRGKAGSVSRKLSQKQQKRNERLSSIRAKVEHPFRIIKCQWKYTKVRYRGLDKNTHQIKTLCALANIYMVRKILLT